MHITFDPTNAEEANTVKRMLAGLDSATPVTETPVTPKYVAPAAQPTAPVLTSDAGPSASPTTPPATSTAPPSDDDVSAETAFAAPPQPPAAPVATTPPPPPAQSAAEAAATAAALPSVELDIRGFPWDARIHSGPAKKRPKTQDGAWRRKRGIADDVTAAVEAELTQIMGAPPAAVPLSPAPPAAPVAAAPPPPPASAPVAPVATTTAADTGSGTDVAATVASFADLMKVITGLQTAGKLTITQSAEFCQSLGLTGLRDFVQRPDLIPAMVNLLPKA